MAPIQSEEWKSKGHGVYSEIAEEKEFFDTCKKSAKVVCHFYRDSTWRCKIVDKHLSLLAPRHLETRLAPPSLPTMLGMATVPLSLCSAGS